MSKTLSPECDPWQHSDLADDFSILHAVAQQYEALVHDLHVISLIERANEFGEEFTHCLQHAVAAAKNVSGFISSLEGTTLVRLRRLKGRALGSSQVFHILEVKEKILLSLEPRDLLNAQQVSHAFCSTILQSKVLRQRLHLDADPQTFVTLIDHHFVRPFSFMVRSVGVPRGTDEPPKFNLLINVPYATSLQNWKYGDRIQSMLICQPPIFELEAKMTCRCNDWAANPSDAPNFRSGVHVIRSKTGFRVKELREAVGELLQAHRLCPFAQLRHHNEQGVVVSGMTLEAPLQLKTNDPRMLAERQRTSNRIRPRAMGEEAATSISAYISAKLLAHNTGQPIPTYAEFRTTWTEVSTE